MKGKRERERKTETAEAFMAALLSQDVGDSFLKRAHLSAGLKGVSDLSGILEDDRNTGNEMERWE